MNGHSFMTSTTPTVVVSKSERIIDAALAVFDEVGYGAAPMPVIAQRAGIAVGSIYRYFASKEALANALYRREKAALALDVLADVDQAATAAAMFRQMWLGLGHFAAAHRAGLCFLELHHHAAYLDDESRALARSIDERLAEFVRSWQQVGAVRDGAPDLLIAQTIGGFVGALRYLQSTGQPITAQLGVDTLASAWAVLEHPSSRHMTSFTNGGEHA